MVCLLHNTLIGGKGIQGLQGKIGRQGCIGINGILGPIGITGQQGYIGNPGPQGVIGPQGIQGDTGAFGTIGIQGEKGGILSYAEYYSMITTESDLVGNDIVSFLNENISKDITMDNSIFTLPNIGFYEIFYNITGKGQLSLNYNGNSILDVDNVEDSQISNIILFKTETVNSLISLNVSNSGNFKISENSFLNFVIKQLS